MKLIYPIKKATITQPFGQNLNTYYAEGGLLGHTGLDMVTFHGDSVFAPCSGIISAVLNKENPDLMQYRGVSIIVEDEGNICYEVQCGHLDHINVSEGDMVTVGQFIGTEGNTGNVAVGGVKVTSEMKNAGSTAGTHLHLNVRLLKKVLKKGRDTKAMYSRDSGWNMFINGDHVYQIVNYENGYNGSVDPMPFLQGEPTNKPPKELLIATLRYGSRGDQVKLLQKKLGIKSDGIFGTMTEQSVKDFQKTHGLKPDGVVGALSRQKINISVDK